MHTSFQLLLLGFLSAASALPSYHETYGYSSASRSTRYHSVSESSDYSSSSERPSTSSSPESIDDTESSSSGSRYYADQPSPSSTSTSTSRYPSSTSESTNSYSSNGYTPSYSNNQQPFPHNEYLEPREATYMNFWVPANDPAAPFFTSYDVCDTSQHSEPLLWDPQLAAQIQKGNGSCVSQGSYHITIKGLVAAYVAYATEGRDSEKCSGEVRFETSGRYAACGWSDSMTTCGEKTYRQFAECKMVGTY
ncbi:MAG: hypothetical protein M1820_000830 [Bogoriella megaspora]|nr:MAG: hypothetical protein M1820_000830 [Bogoriella megaspora]